MGYFVEETQSLVALTRMIASPTSRVFYLAADNRAYPSKSTIETAWRSGRAFFIEVDQNVIAVDYDNVANCRSQQFLFRTICNTVLHRDPVTINSGRGIHQFIRLTDDELHLKSHIEEEARCVGGDVRKTIRPPLSPHRLGLPVSFFHSYETIETATTRLGGIDSLPIQQKLSSVPPALVQRLNGAFVYLDRSHEIADVMSELIREGISDDTIIQIFSQDNLKINQKIQEKTADQATKYIHAQLKQSHRHARIRGQHLVKIDQSIYPGLDDHVRNQLQFHGRSGVIQRDVLLAMIHFARTCASETFHASTRDLQLVAEVATNDSVRRAIKSLVSLGFIEVVSPGGFRSAAQYKITLTLKGHSTGGVTKSALSRSTRFSSQAVPDLFRYSRRHGVRTLGKTAGLVFDWLAAGPKSQTIQQLGERMDRPVANLRRYVAMLESVGLISVGADRQIRVLGFSDEEAIEVKRNLGCLGLREIYEFKIRSQRQAWRAFLLARFSARLARSDRVKMASADIRSKHQYENYLAA